MQQKPGLVASYLLPRLQDIFFIGLLFFVCTQGFRLLNGDGDLGRHITIGNYVLDNWTVPTRDIFSHSMTGEELVPHEWLAGVIFALATRLLGLSGDVLVAGIVIASAFTIVYKQTIDRGVFRLFALLVAALAVLASFLHWLVRPHIFTFLFVAVWMLVLDKSITNNRIKVWVPPLIMLIWANVHGAFIFGFIILGAYVAGWVWEYWQGISSKEVGSRLGIICLSSLAVTFINPVGWRLWDTSAGYMSNSFLVDRTVEYQSPNFHMLSTLPFMVMLVATMVLLGASRKMRMHEILLIAGWCALSLYSMRNIPIYAIVTTPYLGSLFQPILDHSRWLKSLNEKITNMELNLRGSLYPVLAVMAIVFSFTFGIDFDATQNGYRHDAKRFPVDAASWLQENPQNGNMFNHFIWGGYLLYRLWPDQSVFIDGQTDFYGEALSREYTQIASLENGWQDTLQKYNVTWAILPSDRPLVQALRDELGWQVIYADPTATILRETRK